MKALSIALLAALLLMLGGCGDKAAGSKTEAAASAVPAVTAKELTPEEKFAETKKKADAEDAKAQFNIGEMYAKGDGILKDAAKAMEWYQKAAAQGNAEAQKTIGMFYRDGFGITKNADKALDWFQKAAAQGNVNAQISLGVMYTIGEGVPKDAAKAFEWFQKAAVQGDVDAQKALGLMYANGSIGAPKDAAKAVEWYQKAATQGNADAQIALGWMYFKGEGVPKDVAKGVGWWQKAAAQGNADAQNKLGWAYWSGNGVSKNLVLAYAWSNLAAAQGDEGAKINRDDNEAQLSPAQRAEGQRLASNWKKGDTLQASGDNPSGSTSPDSKPIKHSTGTAFVVSNNGHALTNHHVINGCAEVKIAGREGIAKVITSDGVNDLTLLQLPGKVDVIANLNADPNKLRQGEEIIVFGYPLNSLLSSGGNLTPGIISALSGLDNNTNQIQITAPIQGGSSGSPVMDKKGNVVGVVSARLDMKAVRLTGNLPQNVNFAVNGQTVKAFLDANQVPYKTGGGLFSREKSNADIAEEARKWTVLVECWK